MGSRLTAVSVRGGEGGTSTTTEGAGVGRVETSGTWRRERRVRRAVLG
jgi:hypothetical protein